MKIRLSKERSYEDNIVSPNHRISVYIDSKKFVKSKTKMFEEEKTMKSIIALLAVTVLILTLQPAAMAEQYYYDTGQRYTVGGIDPTDGTVYLGSSISSFTSIVHLDSMVDNNPGTHLNVTDGGRVSGQLSTYNNAGITVNGGYVNSLRLEDNSSVTMTDGEIFDVTMNNNSTVSMTGGTIRFALWASDNSAVTINAGWVVQEGLRVMEDATLTMNGGYSRHIEAYGNSAVAITGGEVSNDGGYVGAYDNATVTMRGGSTPYLQAAGNSIITLSGGDAPNLWVYSNGMLYLDGSNFSVTASGVTTPLSNGAHLSNYGTLVENPQGVFYNGELTGTLADGAFIDSSFAIWNTGDYAGTGDIVIIPEPATLLLLGLGAVMLRRKR